ncbi:threonine/homoserine/homoserine lactone efflux protein [Streptomyces griseochromogenes]|uniref:Lysine transporter LysE n=1 Tax=Streptomyces griseochromogenes TaxID=68214 RepID=A0A1B1B3W9_9ACTN|nr:LysE family translocator [Streptomyces griseochromogenes]ANP53503.1 lysine transporter LysE [Streptomyces griseochromogenes]MBP2054669.1 threonine/homoserine/homoserine lactone efflux protein [Streptomyces griseochromogenes]
MDGQLIAFTGIAAGLVAMPGADFTVVVRNALVSRRAGAVCGLGIAGGLLVHTTLAVAGVAAVLVAVPALFRALQLLGGAYVLQLGLRTLWSLHRPVTGPAESVPPAATHPLRQGFVTNVLNPKASLTFLSLLPQFVPSGGSALPKTLLLALIVCAIALAWFQVVALLVDRLGRWLRRPRAARVLQAGTGAALTALGAALLLEPLLG